METTIYFRRNGVTVSPIKTEYTTLHNNHTYIMPTVYGTHTHTHTHTHTEYTYVFSRSQSHFLSVIRWQRAEWDQVKTKITNCVNIV